MARSIENFIYAAARNGAKHGLSLNEVEPARDFILGGVIASVNTDDGYSATNWESGTVSRLGFDHFILLFSAGYGTRWFASFGDRESAMNALDDINFSFPVVPISRGVGV